MLIAALILSSLGPCADVSSCTAKVRAPAELVAPAKAAPKRLRRPEGEPKAPPAKIAPASLRGDTAFGIELEPQGDELIVRALSLHRPPSVYGLVRVKPQVPSSPKLKARALE